MNYYQNFNPYFQPQMQQPIQPQTNRFQTPDQQYVQMQQPQQNYKPVTIGLQGKSVDSIDVVKAMDIPLDGSLSYFPLTDGSAIVTKQLQQDGTSKTLIYKLANSQEEINEDIKYVTSEDLDKALNETQKLFKDDIKDLKKKIKILADDKED